MRKRIFRNVLAVALAVLVVSSALIVTIMYDFITERSRDELVTEALFITAGVEGGGLAYLDAVETDKTSRITWIAADGTVLFDSQSDAAAMENHVDREEVTEALELGEGFSERYSTTLSQTTYYYARMLPDGTVLRVSSTESSIFSMLFELIWPLITVIAGLVVGTFLLAKHSARKIVKPINELDLEHPEQNETYKEVRPLLHRLEKQYERIAEEVEAREALRREFSANVSHELKTPLTSISGIAEIMQSGMVGAEDVPHFAGNIYKESQRLIALVGDIMKISQLDENQVQLEEEPVDLAQVAAEELERARYAAEQRGIQLRLQVPREGGRQPVVTGVRQILQEMVFNLIDNAIKYNREGGTVIVEAGYQGGRIVLSVADTGIGIPEEDQDRVFERFYRVDKSHSKAIGGTGLGLSIVKHGALYHKAAVELESKVGSGTKVTIRF